MNRSRSVENRYRENFRAPPVPPRRPSVSIQQQTIKSRTQSTSNLEQISRTIENQQTGPFRILYKIPAPSVYSRSSSSSSLSTETTLRISSPEPDEKPSDSVKPLYITEIFLQPKSKIENNETNCKPTIINLTDRTQIERRNREILRLENERRSLIAEKEILLKEIDRYKNQPSKNNEKMVLFRFLNNFLLVFDRSFCHQSSRSK